MMLRCFIVLSVCLFLVGCQRNAPDTFSAEQVEIAAEGVTDKGVELIFSVNEEGWACPGVNVFRRGNNHIDVYFLRVSDQVDAPASCDIPVVKDADYAKALKVKIPHDWNESKEVEVFVDGTKSLGKWKKLEEDIEEDY